MRTIQKLLIVLVVLIAAVPSNKTIGQDKPPAVPLQNEPAKMLTEEQKSVEHWIQQLKDRDPKERWHAAYALGNFGPKAKQATGALVQVILLEQDTNVVRYSSYALGQIGPSAREAVGPLAQLLRKPVRSNDRYTRPTVARALGRIGPAAKKAVPTLTEALADKNPSVRVAAALALWKIDPDALSTVEKAVGALSAALVGNDENAAHEAAMALGELRPKSESALDALIKVLQGNNKTLRRSAARTLGKIGLAALQPITEALQHEDPGVRRSAADALGWLGQWASEKILHRAPANLQIFETVYNDQFNKQAVPALLATLKDEDQDVRRLAAEALGKIGPAVVPAVVEQLIRSDKESRDSTIAALKQVELHLSLKTTPLAFRKVMNSQAVESLVKALEHPDESVLQAAVGIFAILEIGAEGKQAESLLRGALKHENVKVRRDARRALQHLGPRDL